MKRPYLAWILGGFAVWSVAFITLYSLHGIGCAHAWDAVRIGPTSLQRLVQVTLWLAFLPPLIALALWQRKRRRQCVSDASRRWVALVGETLAWAGLAATLITFAPTLTASVCV